MITVTVYMASWPPITPISSISTIFPAIKNKIPSGAYLEKKEKKEKKKRDREKERQTGRKINALLCNYSISLFCAKMCNVSLFSCTWKFLAPFYKDRDCDPKYILPVYSCL